MRAALLVPGYWGLFPQSVSQEGVELYLHILILKFVAQYLGTFEVFYNNIRCYYYQYYYYYCYYIAKISRDINLILT